MRPESTTSLVLDFETLSLDPFAAVTEIGIIAVNRADFVTFDHLDIRCSVLPQLADGRMLDRDTILWHEKKKTLETINGRTPLKDGVRQLVEFIAKHNPYRIWAWGKDFERPLFENLCRSLDVEVPDYQYKKFACARDKWADAFGVDHRAPERTHRAHQDCLDELRDLHKALFTLNLKRVF